MILYYLTGELTEKRKETFLSIVNFERGESLIRYNSYIEGCWIEMDLKDLDEYELLSDYGIPICRWSKLNELEENEK